MSPPENTDPDRTPNTNPSLSGLTSGATIEHVPSHLAAPTAATCNEAGNTLEHVTDPTRTLDHVARPAVDSAAIPASVAGYEILGVLGRGGMGIVYKARQRGLKRIVALKMILSSKHATARDLARFKIEAEAVAALQHPNIVQIYEVGEDDGKPFFSLEFVDGTALDKKVKGTPMKPAAAAALMLTLAQAMQYAHERGIVHRDLKPANVLLTADGTPKVADFGLAKQVEDDSGQTRNGSVLGTPSYMSPEQAEGRNEDVRAVADVYSLGAILYELLTGRAPFKGATVLDTLQQVRTREPVAPTQLQIGVPLDLETICLKCLQKDPGKRYATAAALAEDLRRFLAGEPILARPVGPAERLWRWCKRNPRMASLSAVVALLVLAWAVASTVLALSLNSALDETRHQKGIAETKTVEAQKALALAVHNRELADQQANVAKKTAAMTIDKMVDLCKAVHNRLEVKQVSLSAAPQVRKAREDVLARVRQSLLEVGQEVEKAGTTTFGQPAVYQKLGGMLADMGQAKEAIQAYQKCHDLLAEIVEREPNNDQARANLAVARLLLGDAILDLTGDAPRAREHYLAALKIHQEILDEPRDGQRKPRDTKISLSHVNLHLGRALLAMGDPAAATEVFSRSLAYRQEWADEDEKAKSKSAEAISYVMEARMYLGTTRAQAGDAKGAEEEFGHALKIGKQLTAKVPKYAPFQIDLAEVQTARGEALLLLGKPREALIELVASLHLLEKFVNPDDLGKQAKVALAHERAGLALAQTGAPDEAQKRFAQALLLRGELLQIEPANPARQAAYVLTLARAGKHAAAAQNAAVVSGKVGGSTPLLLQLARCYAICAEGDLQNNEQHRARGLAALKAACAGYKAPFVLKNDPELQGLRQEAGFKDVLAAASGR